MYCSKCGKKVQQNKYCSNCGTEVNPKEDAGIKEITEKRVGLYIGRLNRINFTISYSVLFIINSTLGSTITEDSSGLTWAVAFLWVIFTVIIILSVMTRRWHDLNKSGWNSLAILIPVVGLMVILWLIFGKPENENNKYGEPDQSSFSINRILGRA